MPSSNLVIITIVGCGVVTWLTRVLPFWLLKHVNLPTQVREFLSFVPIVIMSTLWFSSLFTAHTGHLPTLNLDYLLASLPTLVAAVISKSLMVIVIVGIVSLAVVRAVMG